MISMLVESYYCIRLCGVDLAAVQLALPVLFGVWTVRWMRRESPFSVCFCAPPPIETTRYAFSVHGNCPIEIIIV